MAAENYNYEHFSLVGEELELFERFPTHLRVGEAAPDASLIDVSTGEAVALSSLWKRSHLVMEFGSFT